MGKKDISTKNLEAYDDVFADIFNVLVFRDNYVKDSGLRDAGTEQVHGDFSGTLHSRYRDCMKQYQDTTMACVSLGIENQTDIDKTMPVRVMGYDYGRYILQLMNSDILTPLVTVVLYFGNQEWKKPVALSDMMDVIPEEVKPYMVDYPIQVVNIRHLSESVRRKFTSDFGEVAEFFATKSGEDYHPSDKPLRHPEAVLHMLHCFTGDDRYEEMETEISDNVRRGEAISMCDFADRMERRGLEKGLKSLLRTLKTIFTEFEDIYQKVILNEDYKDRSREEIRMMLEEV